MPAIMLKELFIVVILAVLTQAVTVSITLTQRQCFKTKYLPTAVVQLVNIFKCLAYD